MRVVGMSFGRFPTVALGFAMLVGAPVASVAQAAPRAVGTVKSVSGNTVMLATESGTQVTVTVPPDAKVLVVPPGSKDLKSATPAAIQDIAVGDRALANGRDGDTATELHAVRLIVIKSTAIAARNENEEADWQRRGTGGIVKAVNGPAITVGAGARTITIDTTPATVFKRYAPDSIRFQDATGGSLADIRPGDQLRARGDKSADGLTVKAEEVVTGAFDNLSGVLASVNPADSTLTLKDLATKKMFTVKITANTDLRSLPPEMAAMLARNRPGAAAGSGQPGEAGAAGTPGAGQRPAGSGAGAGAGGRRSGDLSQLVQRLPRETLADLKPGAAVLIVGSQGTAPGQVTAITILSGVDALLTAPAGTQPFTLSPWNISAPEGGEGGGGQ